MQDKGIWCRYGNWESIAKSEDLDFVRQRIIGMDTGVWEPNRTAPGYDEAIEKVAEANAAAGHGRGTVVDFGCGLGRNASFLRGKFDKVLALDLPDMVGKLKTDPAGSLYDALYDDMGAALSSQPVDVVYESVCWQHIVDADYSATIAQAIEAAPNVRYVMSLNNNGTRVVPKKRGWSRALAELASRGWTVVFEAEDRHTFKDPHTQRILRRPA